MTPSVLILDHGAVDLAGGAVHTRAGSAPLSDVEARLLAYLAARPGEDVHRDQVQVDVWGLDQLRFTRALDTAVRRLRTKIEPVPAAPRHLITLRGHGWRWVPSRRRPALPLPDDPLVGRRALLERAGGALTDGAVVVLTGPAGVGKTRAARHLAAAHAARFDEVAWASLVGVRGAEGVRDAVAHALQIVLSERDPDAQVLRALPRRGRALVVLDDAEPLADAVRDRLAAWRAAAPSVTWLVTSRWAPRIPGERTIEVDPLPTDAAEALFVARARDARARFTADDHIAPLLGRLGGLPLAIELAAARMGVVTPRQLCQRLEHHLGALATRQRDVPDRHRTLLAALDASWELLDGRLREALVGCAAFAGTFDAAAAREVAGADRDDLDALVAHHLLRAEAGRYGFLPPVRAWAEQRGDHADRRVRFARWCAGLRERAFVPRAERENLLAAVELAVARGDAATAAGAAMAACAVVGRTGPHALARSLLDRVLAVPGHTEADRVELRAARATMAALVGEHDEAVAELRSCLAANRGRVWMVQARLGLLLASTPAAEEGLGLLRAAVAAAPPGEWRLWAEARRVNAADVAGMHAVAVEAADAALASPAAAALPTVAFEIAAHRAGCLGKLGRIREGLEAMDGLWAAASPDEDPQTHLCAMSDRGTLLLLASRWEEGAEVLADVLAQARRGGFRAVELSVLGRMGIAWTGLGDWARAEAAFDEQIALGETLGSPATRGVAHVNRGLVRLARGATADAADDFARAVEVSGSTPKRRGLAALAAARLGNADTAESLLAEGAEPPDMERLVRAELALSRGDRAEAAALLASIAPNDDPFVRVQRAFLAQIAARIG